MADENMDVDPDAMRTVANNHESVADTIGVARAAGPEIEAAVGSFGPILNQTKAAMQNVLLPQRAVALLGHELTHRGAADLLTKHAAHFEATDQHTGRRIDAVPGGAPGHHARLVGARRGGAPTAPGVSFDHPANPGQKAWADYIIRRGEELRMTPTEIRMALAVAKHESNWNPVGAMGFGPEAKSAGYNFDQNPLGAVDQYWKQYRDRLGSVPGLNRNDPSAVANYVWHTVHHAADQSYGPKLLSAYATVC